MYDGRSDHPRNGRHKIRHERKEDRGYLPARPTLAEREAMREQLAVVFDLDEPVKIPGLKRLRHQTWSFECEEHITHDMARWEAELLGICDETCQWTMVRRLDSQPWWAQDEVLDGDALAPWEAEAMELPANTVYSTVTPISSLKVRYYDLGYEDSDDEPEYVEDADLDYDAWPAGATFAEVYDALGDGFSIVGPTLPPEPTRVGHYVRVYEVAREVGIEASALVADLQLNGEYVRSHMSWLAQPVADDLVRIKDVLIESYGPRKERPLTWAQECALWRTRFAS